MAKLLTFLATAAALLGALLLSAAPETAQARAVTNIAQAGWMAEGRAMTVSSNEVAIEVAAVAAQIATFRSTAGSGNAITFRHPLCGSSIVPLPGQVQNGSNSVTLSPTETFRIGEILFFTVSAPAANTDAAAIDSLGVTLRASDGDEEELIVYETGENTGVFAGAIGTASNPPAPVSGDCRLSIASGDEVTIAAHSIDSSAPIVSTRVRFLADPYGFVFDSETGDLINGARVTLVDATTGRPATVFAEDGITLWPSTVVTGEPIVDAAGNRYLPQAGEFRFPRAPLGAYRLEVVPPAPYTAPSSVAAADITRLVRPAGGAFEISDASYGRPFPLASLQPVRVDIPIDRPNVEVTLTKTVSRQRAMPGDALFYTVAIRNPDAEREKHAVTLVDTPSQWLRLRLDSVRINGEKADDRVTVSDDGQRIAISFASIEPAAIVKVTYAMVVRADAPAGDALNEAVATDQRGGEAMVRVPVRIERETIASRMTLIGRVALGDCSIGGERPGVPGVRVMLQDGSFAVTDVDGRYHFEGLVPGTHVVQVQSQTLPQGGRFIDCSRSTRAAGSATSRFVTGQGGSLAVADFHAEIPGWKPPMVADKLHSGPPAEGVVAGMLSDRIASGADKDWFALGNGPAEFLFPEVDHNPRSPAIRVAIRHCSDERIELLANGRPVDPLSFDGAKKAPDGTYAVSVWRGVPLSERMTRFEARVLSADGRQTQLLQRVVELSAAPWRAELVPERTKLVADGSTRPVVAVQLTDRKGQPVRSGVSGSVVINAPYESAALLDRLQIEQLVGQGGASPAWHIDGDDGIALIELAPTMVSGPLHLDFAFADGEITRRQMLDTWVVPGDQEWTLIGLAEGSVGERSVADNMESSGRFNSNLGDDARLAFYAKGRVLGRFLLTVAYDSAKQEADQRLLGSIDPEAYYSVFADNSSRRFDAASREKLYVRVESSTFYALYGDFVTGLDQTQLGRYNRTATGLKAEGLFGALHVQGFAAETSTRHRRDEIQGNGLSGPYRLSSRAIIANSEIVAIEVRDRFRSEVLVERRELVRFIDYDVDLLSGTMRLSEPLLSRDSALNPQFLVVDYEIDQLTSTGEWNAGARADYTFSDAIRVGATGITDRGDGARTDIGAVDVRARLGAATEVRAEFAASRSDGKTATGWLIEAEHRAADLDVLAYARSLDSDYGVGQQNGAETGRRKLGLDARYSFTDQLAVTGSVWNDSSLVDGSLRMATQLLGTYRAGNTDLRLGVSRFDDRYADGERGKSTVLEAGATQRMLGNRLALDASGSIALGETSSIDLPARYRFGARYALTSNVRMVGSYEIAEGDAIDARTVRGGVELTPWSGARVISTLGSQDVGEFGKRSFAAFGLAQSARVTENFTLDGTLDVNRSLSGADLGDVINPRHPAANGGHLSQDGSLFEDFTAVTLGAGWRQDRWAATARGEYRDGDFANRFGATAGVIRQVGEGRIVGAGLTWTRATGEAGAQTEILDAALSTAIRPSDSPFALLGKLEYRSDQVRSAVSGEASPTGRTALTVDGDAKSRRLIASLSTNWSPYGNDDGLIVQRAEIGLFIGGRYNSDRHEDSELSSVTMLGGVDARINLSEKFDISAVATVRSNVSDGVTSFAIGPQVGFSAAKDTLLTIGYNVFGFRDQDFSSARNTDKGLFASIKMKFDADSFSFLGLGRNR